MNSIINKLRKRKDYLYSTLHQRGDAWFSNYYIKAGSFEEAEYILNKLKQRTYWKTKIENIDSWKIDGQMEKVIPVSNEEYNRILGRTKLNNN